MPAYSGSVKLVVALVLALTTSLQVRRCSQMFKGFVQLVCQVTVL